MVGEFDCSQLRTWEAGLSMQLGREGKIGLARIAHGCTPCVLLRNAMKYSGTRADADPVNGLDPSRTTRG